MGQVKNILLIDDDNIFNFLNKQIIMMDHFAESVHSHVNAVSALEELSSQCKADGEFPDIIFLDINMPVMDGWEFLEEFEKLPQKFPERCKIYMLSSSIDPNDIEKSKAYKSVKDFISKPLSEEILRAII